MTMAAEIKNRYVNLVTLLCILPDYNIITHFTVEWRASLLPVRREGVMSYSQELESQFQMANPAAANCQLVQMIQFKFRAKQLF